MYEALNNKYYALFSDLYTNRAVLPPKQYEQMAEALTAEYRRELDVLTGHIQLDTGRARYELKAKLRSFLPRRFLFWRNRVAKAIDRACREEFREYIRSIEDKPPQEPEPPSGDPPTSTALTVSQTQQ